MPKERELALARLARMERLVKDLEQQCEQGVEQRELFRKLKAQMAAARHALKQH